MAKKQKKNDYQVISVGMLITNEEVSALVNEFSNTYINAVDNPLASQVIQRMILWNNEQLSKRSIKAE